MDLTAPRSAAETLLAEYDAQLRRHGDTAAGAHWPDEAARLTRFDVMLGVVTDPAREAAICDFACGTGELLTHIEARGLDRLQYIGADRSSLALSYARRKHPGGRFVEIDLSRPDASVAMLECDYLVCNGLFTVKWDLPYESMWRFLESTIRQLWPVVRRGLAFNVMSTAVEWQRDDLFHVPMDDLARLLHGIAGRRVVFRADYGLFEYTAYVYRGTPLSSSAPERDAPGR